MTLDERMVWQEAATANLTAATAANTHEIGELGKLLRGRPSWAVTVALTGLSTALGVTVTALVAELGRH